MCTRKKSSKKKTRNKQFNMWSLYVESDAAAEKETS